MRGTHHDTLISHVEGVLHDVPALDSDSIVDEVAWIFHSSLGICVNDHLLLAVMS